MSDSQTLKDGKIGIFHYTLKTADGETIDASGDEGPVAYLHGSDNIVIGLERALEGKTSGDRVTVTVSPEDGYGIGGGTPPVAVGRDAIPEDMELFEGLMLAAEDEDGEPMAVWVTEVTKESFSVSPDHPLAGMELHYDVQLTDVRDATAEEKSHGHPHGLDGTHSH